MVGTSEMIFPIPRLIEKLSAVLPLRPGDELVGWSVAWG